MDYEMWQKCCGGGVVCGAVRNHYFVGSLWFLTCLFLMEISFEVMRRYLNRYLILIICILASLVFNRYLAINYPFMWYNVDSVFRYAVYYAIGYCFFPSIEKLFKLDTNIKKGLFYLSGIGALCYSTLLFNEHDLLSPLYSIPYIGFAFSILGTLIPIWFVLILAKIFEKIAIFRNLGAHTLYLCGNEYIAKNMIPAVIGLLGLDITISNPLAAFLYTAFLLIFADRVLRPIEKRIIREVCVNIVSPLNTSDCKKVQR